MVEDIEVRERLVGVVLRLWGVAGVLSKPAEEFGERGCGQAHPAPKPCGGRLDEVVDDLHVGGDLLVDAHLLGMSTTKPGLEPLLAVDEQASLNLASELLGHADPKVTVEHYIRRNEHVNPLTAELLDAAFARADDE